ncbi:MFS transporter [Actinoplanes sp. NPDC048796]|uniref:MFS transporter n=1 Tax=Actinoplanes sp. NPDC048796 TaxID=3155640 RepID=UPI0033F7AE8E
MSALAPLRHAPFRLLIAGRTINALGNSFATLALAFAVLDLTGSTSDLGLVVGIRTLVNVMFLLFGGVLADRMPKQVLMVGSSLAAALSQGIVAFLVLSDLATVPLLIVLGAVNGMVGALALPASSSILPQTVPADVRQQANAINRLTLNSAVILGAPLAGVVVAATNPGWGIAIDAVTFLLAGLVFLALRSLPAPAKPKDAARPHIFADLRTGWTEFWSRTWLWVVVAAFAVINACWSGGLYVLGPAVADDTFGRQSWGFVLAAQTGGMILGALIAMRLRVRRLLLLGAASTFGMALPLLLLGLYPHVVALIVGALLAGGLLEQFGVAWETTMQEHVPADKLARVYSYDMVGSFIAMPIGELLVGPISHRVGVRATLVGAGVLVIVAVLGMLASRDVRTLRHELPERDPGPVKESVP